MSLRRITETPTTADVILFDILCPDSDGCLKEDHPYKVNQILIYFLEKSFVDAGYGEYENQIQGGIDSTLMAEYTAAQTTACAVPSEENLKTLATLQEKIDLQTKVETIRYNDAKLVAIFGDDNFPAWLNTDVENAFITKIDEDTDGNSLYGHFEAQWTPLGMRGGNYFICWTWTPILGASTITAHEFFTLSGATQIATSIPSHRTDPKKYPTLQDRYLPEMFKTYISQNDETPQILHGLNNVVADGFTFLEDFANQILDVIDANATNEYYLTALANLFSIKLRSSDPTLWRRQIKEAVPLLKKKGTLAGLQTALAQASIDLVQFTKLWQVISSYTWQECFDITVDGQDEFELSKLAVLPVETLNFEIYYRPAYSDPSLRTDAHRLEAEWELLTPFNNYVSLANIDSVTYMTWIGNALEVGDSIRIVYKIVEIPGSGEQAIEDYIRQELSLMDLRDERSQIYPPKNWNVRVIEEDDAFFDIIIPTRHPYYDPLIWGWVRTEFPYSENIYNMEEYNGSTRESKDPCDIDKDFVDPCKGCQSSKYVVALDIGSISDDRIAEAQEIIREFTPFHAVLHSIYLGGKVEDFVRVTDSLSVFIHMRGEETTIAGNGQIIFSRVMTGFAQGRRDVLATMTPVPDDISKTGTGNNKYVFIYAPMVNFEHIGVASESDNVLQILDGSNEGVYSIDTPEKNHAEIVGVVEPFSISDFPFRLSNRILEDVTTNIYQDDEFKFTDTNINFMELGVHTMWDTNYTPSVITWQVAITSPVVGTYAIENILPNNDLVLYDPTESLPTTTTTDVEYTLLNESSVVVVSGSTGVITSKRRGRVDMSSLITMDNIQNYVKLGYYLKYPTEDDQYRVTGFVPNETHQFYISSYAGLDQVGILTDVYERLVENQTGYLFYDGMILTTSVDYESLFGIQNGTNAPINPTDNDLFKENFLILIGTDYYAISEWNGTQITLVGPPLNWGVMASSSVQFKIYQFTKNAWSVWEKQTGQPINKPATFVPAHDFTFVDRRGNEVIEIDTETRVSALMMSKALNATKKGKNETLDSVGQQESITYSIEYRN